MHHGGLNMKHKTVSTIAAILCGGFLALVASITACSQEQRTTIHIEGTIADDQGNAMNGVSAYVTFSRRRAENRYSELQSFDETINSSFRFEGKGDRIDVTFARKGYAPQGLLLNRDDGDLILRDLRIVMKKTTPEEIAESLFEAMDFWMTLDDIDIEEGEKCPETEDRLEKFRKAYVLEKSDMTNIFTKTIQDYISDMEKGSENKKLQGRAFYAFTYLGCYPVPQKEFMELIQKTFKVDPIYTENIINSYIKAYPDWIFDDKPIIEIIHKINTITMRLDNVYIDLSQQIKNEKDEIRRKKLLDKAYEWAFQDDKLEIFYALDRLLLDCCGQEYAELPARKNQLEKELKHYEEAREYYWSYLRCKYALEHFGEGDEALEMLYKLDTDHKLKLRIMERIEELKKAGKDPSSIYSKEFLDELYNAQKTPTSPPAAD